MLLLLYILILYFDIIYSYIYSNLISLLTLYFFINIEMTHYTLTINTTRNHAKIVIGKNQSYLQKINSRYNVNVQIHNPTIDIHRNVPMFSITGPKENIQNAAIHIYNIIHQSMFKTEAQLRSTIYYNNEKHQCDKLLIYELKQQISTLQSHIQEIQSKLS